MKQLKNYSLKELNELCEKLLDLPQEISYTINGKEIDIEEYIEERTEEFFNVSREDYKAIIGKCFYCESEKSVLKIIDLPDDKEDYEFLYEIFYQDNKKINVWYPGDYIWLQDNNYDLNYNITDFTDMNIAREEMFCLGKDGNLYIDSSCSGEYDLCYELVDEYFFNFARESALKNKK